VFTARRTRSLAVPALIVLAIGSSPVPAFADTLAITSLDCRPRHVSYICTGYVDGGTGTYTYAWNHGAVTSSYNGPASSSAVFSCPAGTTAVRSIAFTVTDSNAATVTQSTSIDCSLTW
jgi:hypothetical protein